jgi:hypothetical protein
MDPFESLLTQPSGSTADPELLEMLGRKASQMFQQQGVPLNDAITQIVAEHPDLGNEHIKRIVEFANTVTFQEMFQSSADKNIHFQVADPGVILRDLKDGGSPQHTKPMNGDYSKPPVASGSGGGFPEVDQLFTQQFGSGGNGGSVDTMPKVASVSDTNHSEYSNPIDNVYHEHLTLKASREKLAEAYETFWNKLDDASEDLYRHVRKEVVEGDGAGFNGVIDAMSKVAADEIVQQLLSPMVERLANEGWAKETIDNSFEKKAGVVVNPEHPIVVITSAIVKLAHEMAVTTVAISELDESLEKTSDFLKTAGKLATNIKHAIGVKGKVPSGLRQRFKRSH